MKLSYDSAKNDSNIAKHGLSLSEAELIDWGSAISWVDHRKNYGEERRVALALINKRLHCVVYVGLKTSVRIISLRKANNREMNTYEEKTN
ncbi:BrnT family toxin [Polynucleobacter sp. AP-Elch-400A-B2]|uniref:BrnT family toxin n=1 Tax=Polynucleobacter sp. AP-Elch-400A-B2 TaxID=2576930 RepID=UPI001BFD1A8F|nr:BrnT family toxin [Polynucleobacter sp. AP-Elch-400A-B2]QWE23899.1 BrnT family toxin [Polynucleobacter sp. AP-Elch-400A-B2]